jgi:hypothetical protein
MAIVRKDKMLAGYDGNLESVKIHDNAGTNKVDSTNGVFVFLNGLLAGEREVYKAQLANEADAPREVYFIHNSEVMYDERLFRLEDFVIKADKVARAYGLFNGDIMTLTTDLFSGAVAVGDKLIVKSNGKLGKASVQANLDGAKIQFEVIEDCGYELHQTMGSFAVKVIRK